MVYVRTPNCKQKKAHIFYFLFFCHGWSSHTCLLRERLIAKGNFLFDFPDCFARSQSRIHFAARSCNRRFTKKKNGKFRATRAWGRVFHWHSNSLMAKITPEILFPRVTIFHINKINLRSSAVNWWSFYFLVSRRFGSTVALEREPNILVDFFWCCCSPWHGTNNNYHSSGKSRDSLASERQQRRTVLAIYTIDGVRILIKFHLSSISHFCHIARNIGIGACVVKSFRAIATNEIDSWYF